VDNLWIIIRTWYRIFLG